MTETAEGVMVTLWNNVEVELPSQLHHECDIRDTDDFRISVVTKDHGDYRLAFNKKDPIQVSAAKILFDRMIGEGMECFKISYKKAKKGEEDQPREESKRTKIKEFDPEADDLLFLPLTPSVGG